MLCQTRKFLPLRIGIRFLPEARSGRAGTKLSERFTLRELERKVKENLQGELFLAIMRHFETNMWLLYNIQPPRWAYSFTSRLGARA